VKLEGTLETLIVEKFGNATLVQDEARGGILRYPGEASLEIFFGFFGFASLQEPTNLENCLIYT